jgi:RNA polymerase sigma factor (sigma-70 family)
MLSVPHNYGVPCSVPEADVTDDRDRELFERFRGQGDRGALEELFQRNLAVAYQVAQRYAASAADAEDAVQNGCMRAMVRAGQYRGHGSVRGWLLGIIVNECLMKRRADRRRERAHEQVPAPGSNPERPEVASAVAEELARLPEHYRVAVAHRYLDDLSFTDIAAICHVREKSARSRVERGLNHLRGNLARLGYVLSAAAVARTLVEHGALASVPAGLAAKVSALAGQTFAAVAPGTSLSAAFALKAIAIAVALAAVCGSLYVMRSPRPVAAAAQEQPVPMLDRVITVDFLHEDLASALNLLNMELKIQDRPRFAYSSGIAQAPGKPRSGITWSGSAPLRTLFDQIATQASLRWRSHDDIVIFESPTAHCASNIGDVLADTANSREDRVRYLQKEISSGDLNAMRQILLCLNDRRPEVAEIAGAIVLAGGRLKDPEFELLYVPCAVWAFSDDQQVRDAAIASLSTDSARAAIALCAYLRSTDAITPLTAIVHAALDQQESRGIELALRAVFALGIIGGERSAQVLLDVVSRAEDELMQMNFAHRPFPPLAQLGTLALEALGNMRCEKGAKPLQDLLDKTDNESLAGRIAEVLLAIDDESATRAVLFRLIDLHRPLRYHLRGPGYGTRHSYPDLVASAAQIVTDGSLDERDRGAVQVLKICRSPEARRPLLALLNDPELVARSTAEELGRHIQDQPEPHVGEAERERAAIIDHLAEIFAEKAVPDLDPLLRDPSTFVRHYAAYTMLRFSNPQKHRQGFDLRTMGGFGIFSQSEIPQPFEYREVRRRLRAISVDTEDPRSDRAFELLDPTDPDDRRLLISSTAADRALARRSKAIAQLAEAHSEGAENCLIALCADDAAEIRAAALTQVSALPTPAAFETTKRKLADPSAPVRAIAVRGIYRYSSDIESVRASTHDPEAEVRTELVLALSDTCARFPSDRTCLEMLAERAGSDVSAKVRQSALTELAGLVHKYPFRLEFDGPVLFPTLIRAASDDDVRIRLDAVRSLHAWTVAKNRPAEDWLTRIRDCLADREAVETDRLVLSTLKSFPEIDKTARPVPDSGF